MPCVNLKIGNASAIVCGLPRRKKCFYCGKPSEFLCDFPVGKKRNGKTKDCDRALCAGCTQKGVSENVDFCKTHYPIARAAFERRQARTT